MIPGKRGTRSLYGQWRNAVIFISGALVAMALWVVVPAMNAYVRAESSMAAVQEYETLLVAFRSIASERAPSNILMSVDVGSDPTTVVRLKATRRSTDEAFSALEQIKILPLAPGTVRGLREQLARARAGVDTVAATPYEHRSLEKMTLAIAAIFSVLDNFQPAVALVARKLEEENPNLAGSVSTVLIATNLREQAGRLGSYIVPSVALDVPLSSAVTDRINRTHGNIDQLMQMLAMRLDVSQPSQQRLMADVRRLFVGRGIGLIEKLTRDGRTGSQYSVARAALMRLYVPTLGPLEDLRKVAIRTMVADIAHSRDLALQQLIGVAAATLLLLALLVFVMRRLFLSVLRPLLTAQEMIVGLAEEKPVDRKELKADTQELNDLFDAITQLEGQLPERREMTERLRFQAETDALTGLLNRSRFAVLGEKRFAAAAASMGKGDGTDRAGSRIGVLYIDLDGFKAVNDTLGHFAGDQLLREIGARLSSVVAREDLLARMGGDEFAICTCGQTRQELEEFATLILLQFNQPLDIAGLPVRVGASLGVAFLTDISPTNGRVQDFTQLCRNADFALYDAKRNGRNTYRFFNTSELSSGNAARQSFAV